MKQSATDYLYEQFISLFMQYHEEDVPTINFGELITEAHEQAKAMEREQIEQAIDACRHNYKHSDNYYNETYNQ